MEYSELYVITPGQTKKPHYSAKNLAFLSLVRSELYCLPLNFLISHLLEVIESHIKTRWTIHSHEITLTLTMCTNKAHNSNVLSETITNQN